MIEKAKKLLEYKILCDECLGRFFALKGTGLTNKERGYALKTIILMEHQDDDEIIRKLAETGFPPAIKAAQRKKISFEHKKCELCHGLFDRLDEIVEKIAAIVNSRDVEFATFLVGATGDTEINEIQENLASMLEIPTLESFRNNLSRELGKRLTEKLGKKVAPVPDIVIIFNIKTEEVKISINPVFFEGRYLKYVRDLPQTTKCKKCHGKGCEYCEWTGLGPCVEREIVAPLYKLTGGSKIILHAAGREDKDVRMLGTGRPFVVEVKNPRVRSINLNVWAEEVKKGGKVEIKELKRSTRYRLVELKRTADKAQKEYVGIALISREIDESDLRELENALNNAIISQYTPLRALKERANLLRKKKLYWIKTELVDKNKIRFRVRTQGGLYIKELVSGDNGRTSPSFAEILGAEAKCIELDVVAVLEKDES